MHKSLAAFNMNDMEETLARLSNYSNYIGKNENVANELSGFCKTLFEFGQNSATNKQDSALIQKQLRSQKLKRNPKKAETGLKLTENSLIVEGFGNNEIWNQLSQKCRSLTRSIDTRIDLSKYDPKCEDLEKKLNKKLNKKSKKSKNKKSKGKSNSNSNKKVSEYKDDEIPTETDSSSVELTTQDFAKLSTLVAGGSETKHKNNNDNNDNINGNDNKREKENEYDFVCFELICLLVCLFFDS